MAAKLKTPALRAAYLQAIREAEAGKGMDALGKVLKVAFYERNRYFANRIARTELHRNFSEQRSREWMATDRIQYIQLRLSSKHPKTDIRDYHANLNAYGLGPGVYPKAKAPQPPFHPHCLCLTAPFIDINPKSKPQFNPNAERAFLQALPPNEARLIAGSRGQLERALKGGESLEAIYNDGKDALYQWRRVGDILTAAGATTAGGAVSNAYEVAKAGGKHKGLVKNYRDRPIPMLERAISSLEQRIVEHQAKIVRPQEFLRPNVPDVQIRHLVTVKWPEEIETFQAEIQVLKGLIEEKTRGRSS